jgi:hypothetical protein
VLSVKENKVHRFIVFCAPFISIYEKNYRPIEYSDKFNKCKKEELFTSLTMEDEKLNKPTSRKNSSVNSDNGKEIQDKGDNGEVTLKAKMSLVNGITVIVGSIIGELFVIKFACKFASCTMLLTTNMNIIINLITNQIFTLSLCLSNF